MNWSSTPIGSPATPGSRGTTPATVLVVAMVNSVHTIRWLRAARGKRMRFVLVPAAPEPVENPEEFVPVACVSHLQRLAPHDIGLWSPDLSEMGDPEDALPAPLEFSHRRFFRQGASIVRAIRALRPQLVHSMEMQIAGYTCLAAARQLGAEFPRWLVSNWGSDLFLYSKLRQHLPILKEIMATADLYISECCRDVSIARQLGFGGTVLSPLPASGGADLSGSTELVPPSRRREVLIKGYHGWSGRGMHILSALHLARAELRGLHIRIVQAPPAIAEMVDALRVCDRLHVTVEPRLAAHADALRRLGNARMSVGLGISGGIDTTMLESMSLGTFPIVANTTCASEWITSGRDGFIVDPHDLAELARVIIRSATDDELVDVAAKRNRAEVMQRWNAETNRMIIQRHYEVAMGWQSGSA